MLKVDRVMIDDMEALDDLSDSSVDGNTPTPIFVLDKDALGQIARFLKPSDVFSLSLTCKYFSENGKFIMGTMRPSCQKLTPSRTKTTTTTPSETRRGDHPTILSAKEVS